MLHFDVAMAERTSTPRKHDGWLCACSLVELSVGSRPVDKIGRESGNIARV
eukprot:SAG31_NODE_35118_length_326_cov_0.682819_1_plen_50_part_10